MKCTNIACQAEVPDHKRFCVVCGADAGFPNVRACNEEEVTSLKKRVMDAENEASVRGCKSIVNDFREAVKNSCAVICRPLSTIYTIINNNSLYTNFYKGVYSDSRLPENNEWDKIRESVDSLMFPYYYKEVSFASLSIDGHGLVGYGDYCMVLRDFSIRDRATVLDENAILFIQKHRIVAGDSLPLGYKASWGRRDDIAIAKLSSQLRPTTAKEDYQSIIMSSGAKDSDFIEVHIYGQIHINAIKSVSGPEPKHREDKIILKSLKRKLHDVGSSWEGY